MRNRVVLNVATGRYVRGQARLKSLLNGVDFLGWTDEMPPGSPTHGEVPYAFKSWAIQEAKRRGYTSILWADACIYPAPDLSPLWERIERDGCWISNNGWLNGQWCSDAALPLFGMTREEAMEQKHVVATSFALNLAHPVGQQIAAEYHRFACNGSFFGPWSNKNGEASSDSRVLGHRHDQTALSVIAHRMGLELTDPPAWFAYRGGEIPSTCLIADGSY